MRGEVGELASNLGEDGLSVEKQQEQQLMNKLAATGKLPAKPASSFLQKRLNQRKFFDSGDYAMDKDKKGGGAQTKTPTVHPLAGAVGACLNAAAPAAPPSRSPEPQEPTSPEGGDSNLQIPRPDTVPQRKASIINPSASRLQPMPHVQHHDSLAAAEE